MKILITGANGFIGKKLVAFLSFNTNYKIIALVRSQDHACVRENVKYIVGDLLRMSDLHGVLSDIDAVIHSAGRAHIMDEKAQDPLAEFLKLNRDVTLNLADLAASNGVKRFIYISSIKVLGECTDDQPPYSVISKANPSDPYAISKLEAEVGLKKLAKKHGLEIVIIRPPLVYGAGVKGNFGKLLNLVKSPIPLPFGSIHNSRSMVSVENLVDLIGRCLWHPNAVNETFLVSDGENLSTPDLISLIATTGGYKVKMLNVPLRLLKFTLMCLGKSGLYDRLCRSMVVDIESTQKKLDWRPLSSVKNSITNCWTDVT